MTCAAKCLNMCGVISMPTSRRMALTMPSRRVAAWLSTGFVASALFGFVLGFTQASTNSDDEAYIDLLLGNNVLAHVDDTQGFLRGAATLIDDDGAVIVEVPYAREMLLGTEYDTIYHLSLIHI